MTADLLGLGEREPSWCCRLPCCYLLQQTTYSIEHTNLFQEVNIFLRIHKSEQRIQRSLLKIFLPHLHPINTFYQNMFDCDSCITCHTNRRLFFSSKERNASNKNDQYVVYLEFCLFSLSYEMIIVCPKALVKSPKACLII